MFVNILDLEKKNYILNCKEQNLRKATKATTSFYIFLTTPDEVEKYVQLNSFDICIHRYDIEILNIFGPELYLVNTKPMEN